MKMTTSADYTAQLIAGPTGQRAGRLPGASAAAVRNLDANRDRFISTGEVAAAVGKMAPAERDRLEAAAERYQAARRLPLPAQLAGTAGAVAMVLSIPLMWAAPWAGIALAVGSMAVVAAVELAGRRRDAAPARELGAVAQPLFEAVPR